MCLQGCKTLKINKFILDETSLIKFRAYFRTFHKLYGLIIIQLFISKQQTPN